MSHSSACSVVVGLSYGISLWDLAAFFLKDQESIWVVLDSGKAEPIHLPIGQIFVKYLWDTELQNFL